MTKYTQEIGNELTDAIKDFTQNIIGKKGEIIVTPSLRKVLFMSADNVYLKTINVHSGGVYNVIDTLIKTLKKSYGWVDVSEDGSSITEGELLSEVSSTNAIVWAFYQSEALILLQTLIDILRENVGCGLWIKHIFSQSKLEIYVKSVNEKVLLISIDMGYLKYKAVKVIEKQLIKSFQWQRIEKPGSHTAYGVVPEIGDIDNLVKELNKVNLYVV